jgi:hypothetical protein
MSHDDLVQALRAIDGLRDVGRSQPNLHFRSQPFLHFHIDSRGIFADVRLGTGGFEPVPCATSTQRAELLARVYDHVEHVQRTRKTARKSSA